MSIDLKFIELTADVHRVDCIRSFLHDIVYHGSGLFPRILGCVP